MVYEKQLLSSEWSLISFSLVHVVHKILSACDQSIKPAKIYSYLKIFILSLLHCINETLSFHNLPNSTFSRVTLSAWTLHNDYVLFVNLSIRFLFVKNKQKFFLNKCKPVCIS